MDSENTIKDRITSYLNDAVRAVLAENVETTEAINSQETTNAVCYGVEAALLHGLKGTSTNKNFWNLLKKFTHKATLLQISELSQISTDVGRCRAWIRIAINDGALDSYCKVLTDDTSTLRHYYDATAYLRDVEQSSALQTHLQGLCNFMFCLAFNSTVLNQWTTTTLVLSGLTPSGHVDWPAASASFSKSTLDSHLQKQRFLPHVSSSPIPTSSSCPQGLSDAFDASSLQLSQSDIDAIRDMSSALRECSETPVSMLSRPDFTENRPAIYAQITYGITSDSEPETTDTDNNNEQRDLRFERIVRSNLDRYPLDYDRNQANQPTIITISGKSNLLDGGDLMNNQSSRELSAVHNADFDCAFKTQDLVNGAQKPSIASDLIENDIYMVQNVSNVELNNKKEQVISRNPFQEDEPASLNPFEDSKFNPKPSDDSSESKVTLGESLDPYVPCRLKRKNAVRKEVNPGSSAGSSNDLDDVIDDDFHERHAREVSFRTLLKNYVPTNPQQKMRTLDAIIDTLPKIDDSGETVQEDDLSCDWQSSESVGTYDNSMDKVDSQSEFLYQISIEKGLGEQCYQCRNCAGAIGMFYDQDNVCSFDGFHYCNDCHTNKEHIIPSKVVYNWDFRPYKVSDISYDYLKKITESPMLNIERLNIKLYGHVLLLDSILTLRTQLRFAKTYLLTCTQAVAEEFMKKFHGQSYLFENIHLYSLQDLMLVPSGSLQKRLQKLVKFSTDHVYSCHRCCQKGFYCEICKASKVIYPFETSSTYRCETCKAVYHSHCKTHLVPCPKCKRLSERDVTLQRAVNPMDSVDYSFRSENGMQV